MNKYDIGFDLAFEIAMANSHTLGTKNLPVLSAVNQVVAETVFAAVDSPSVVSSLKDGYAVISSDLACASSENPVRLKIIATVAAGERNRMKVRNNTAVRIFTGAPLPEGADAVLADEFTKVEGKYLTAFATVDDGKNVLRKGADIFCGEQLTDVGQTLTPQNIGLLVAGGVVEVPVFCKPKIGLIAAGSEILLPGKKMTPGKLYASNVALQQAWFHSVGIESQIVSSKDSEEEIAQSIRHLLASCDVVITSGGAWKSDRDLVVKVLDALGWEMLFHRIRMGPGKAFAMGIVNNKTVFCLPGGPASNEAAFMMIVFPSILKIAGFAHSPYLLMKGKIERDITGQIDWTQIVQCEIIQQYPEIILRPQKLKSRLAAMTRCHAIVKIPEGVEKISAGSTVELLCPNRELFQFPISQ